jgi:hypothetical protein
MISIRQSLAALLISMSGLAIGQTHNQAFLDLTDKSFSKETVELRSWNFFQERLIDHTQSLPLASEPISIMKERRRGTYGTFVSLVKINPELKNKTLAIEVPSVFSSYQLLINGNLVGGKGKVGTELGNSAPFMRPDIYFFTPGVDTLQLILQMTNFYPEVGGIKKEIRLGAAETFTGESALMKRLDYTLLVTLFSIFVFAICFYYIRFEHRQVFSFLGFFALSWFFRCLFGYYYHILDWVDIDWIWLVRIEYLSLVSTTIFAVLFIAGLFPQDFNRRIKLAVIIICSAFAISIMVLNAHQFVPAIVIYLGFSILVVVYALFVNLKAFVNSRKGVVMMLITMICGSIAFGYAIICYLAFWPTNMFVYNGSFIILGIMLLISVSIRLSKMEHLSETNVLTLEHFYQTEEIKENIKI